MSNQPNKKFDLFRRIEELPSRLYILLAVVMLAIHVVICTYTKASAAIVGLVLILLYLLVTVIVYLVSRHQLKLYRIESDASEEQNNSVIYAFRNRLSVPYAVVTETGKIVTVNQALRQAAGRWDTVFNADITGVCHCSMEEILHTAVLEDNTEEETEETDASHAPQKKCVVTVGEGLYRVDCHPLHAKNKQYYMLIFHDVTELTHISELHHNQLTAVGYIVLDNLEEIAQYVKVSYQSEARQVEKILKDWAVSMGGILREYDRNKYMVLLSRQMLSSCIKNKFEILDSIRDVRIGDDNMPITVSMGIATTGDSLSARERDALVALDMALQRGGDQVVLKNETGNYYFGGRTKSQQKRTRGHSRIIASRLCSMISAASNVIVMGHSNPDFDSIGACVGIAALSMHLGVDVKIVTDLESESFKACTARLRELADYKNVFVDGVAGLGESAFGTLLIVVDANNFKILEAPDIAAHSFKTAVIDHHIKKEEFENEPQLAYIDPTASSACELISEILEQSLPEGTLRKEEANIMMSGIMVDTKNFTRTVGTRTFAAALYLRGAGASTEYARTFFEEAFEDYHTEAQFGSEARIYRDQIAITALEGSGSAGDRVAAAKAADKLLTVRNVNAAFALIRIGNVVHISARSTGTINVQLILEKIGGGGHFDVAGAAIAESELKEAELMLLGAINAYFDEIES
ncbi:MAG: DHH family phosphoesterase [Clostridia bacterium]|nr:DHH family phosphoesterase [Clostridia bacterium]